MATMPDVQSPADQLAFIRQSSVSSSRSPLPIQDHQSAVTRAENAYIHTIHQAQMLSAICFFIATAVAVVTSGAAANAMIGMLCVAAVSTLTGRSIAVHRFRMEVERSARAEGLSNNDAQRLASNTLSTWHIHHGSDR